MLFEADFQYYQVIEPVKLSAGRTTLSTDVPSWWSCTSNIVPLMLFETKVGQTQSCTEELDIFASLIFQSWWEDMYSNARL